MKTNTPKAFTLIELLIVVSVISLLSTVILYQTSEARLKADDAKMKQQVKEVEKAVSLYREDNGFVPYSSSYENIMLSEDDDDVDKKAAYEESLGMLVPDYIPAIPTSPDGTSYSYMATTDGGSAVFAANLNNSSSNSGNNSCDVVGGGGGEKTYSDCVYEHQQVDQLTCDNAGSYGYTWDENSEECFDNEVYLCLADYDNECLGSSSNENILPNEACIDYFTYEEDGGGYVSCLGWGEFDPIIVCSFVEADSVCSGASNSDYCSCI